MSLEDAYAEKSKRCSELQQQRDELLAALNEIIEWSPGFYSAKLARAAIKRIEGREG